VANIWQSANRTRSMFLQSSKTVWSMSKSMASVSSSPSGTLQARKTIAG
jgi:hypothetical protein